MGNTMQHEAAFTCRFEVRWADLDGNRHVRNTAFSEYASHTRFQLLAAHGFTPAKLESLRFGPVMMREEIRYKREVLFGDTLSVNVSCAGRLCRRIAVACASGGASLRWEGGGDPDHPRGLDPFGQPQGDCTTSRACRSASRAATRQGLHGAAFTLAPRKYTSARIVTVH